MGVRPRWFWVVLLVLAGTLVLGCGGDDADDADGDGDGGLQGFGPGGAPDPDPDPLAPIDDRPILCPEIERSVQLEWSVDGAPGELLLDSGYGATTLVDDVDFDAHDARLIVSVRGGLGLVHLSPDDPYYCAQHAVATRDREADAVHARLRDLRRLGDCPGPAIEGDLRFCVPRDLDEVCRVQAEGIGLDVELRGHSAGTFGEFCKTGGSMPPPLNASNSPAMATPGSPPM